MPLFSQPQLQSLSPRRPRGVHIQFRVLTAHTAGFSGSGLPSFNATATGWASLFPGPALPSRPGRRPALAHGALAGEAIALHHKRTSIGGRARGERPWQRHKPGCPRARQAAGDRQPPARTADGARERPELPPPPPARSKRLHAAETPARSRPRPCVLRIPPPSTSERESAPRPLQNRSPGSALDTGNARTETRKAFVTAPAPLVVAGC